MINIGKFSISKNNEGKFRVFKQMNPSVFEGWDKDRIPRYDYFNNLKFLIGVYVFDRPFGLRAKLRKINKMTTQQLIESGQITVDLEMEAQIRRDFAIKNQKFN